MPVDTVDANAAPVPTEGSVVGRRGRKRRTCPHRGECLWTPQTRTPVPAEGTASIKLIGMAEKAATAEPEALEPRAEGEAWHGLNMSRLTTLCVVSETKGLVFGGDCAELDLRVFNVGLRVQEEVEVESEGESKAKSYELNDWG